MGRQRAAEKKKEERQRDFLLLCLAYLGKCMTCMHPFLHGCLSG